MAEPKKARRKGPGRKIEPLDVSQLVADPQNARLHNDRNRAAIAASLQEVGAARSIVIDETGTVLAGNATARAALEIGLIKLQVVDVDGDTLVAVRRSGLSARQKARLALADNRTAELAEGWDPAVLKQMLAEGVSLEGLWSPDELVDLFDGALPIGKTDPDAVPAPRPTSIKPGDLFVLGRHRLLCGDATDAAAVARLLDGAKPRLMVTDPPYGVDYDPAWRHDAGVNNSPRVGKVSNDDRADWSAAWRLFTGDVAYVWHAGVFASIVSGSLEATGFEIRSQIVWKKPRIVLSRGHYHWQHEPCWYAVRKGRTASWAGKRNQSTIWPVAGALHLCQSCGALDADVTIDALPSTLWEIDQKDASGVTTHGTQKPVECMARAMRNHKAPEVYEPFSGSGTSIIAAELLGRSCLAMELDPTYVQQAVDRWEAFTGKRAVKVV